MHVRVLLSVVAFGALGAGFLQRSPERWTAVSTTASSITGDVTFAGTRLTFANGSTLRIAYERTVRADRWAGMPSQGVRIALYRVLGGGNPSLLHGNRLCDRRPAYLSISRKPAALASPGNSGLLELAVFSGARPRGTRFDALCATYTYEVRAG